MENLKLIGGLLVLLLFPLIIVWIWLGGSILPKLFWSDIIAIVLILILVKNE